MQDQVFSPFGFLNHKLWHHTFLEPKMLKPWFCILLTQMLVCVLGCPVDNNCDNGMLKRTVWRDAGGASTLDHFNYDDNKRPQDQYFLTPTNEILLLSAAE